MWDIYYVTNIKNNKSYIGLSSNVQERWKNHVRDSITKNKTRYHAFQAAIAKYGKDSFTWEIIESHDTLEAANAAEDFFIEYLNTLAPNGYNLVSGGDSHKPHETTKKKISETLKKTSSLIGKSGDKHYMFGKHLDQDKKDNLILKNSGELGPGTKLTNEAVISIYNFGLQGFNTTEILARIPQVIGQNTILNILHKKCWKQTLELLPEIDFSKLSRRFDPKNPKPIRTRPQAHRLTKEEIANICLCQNTTAELAKLYNVCGTTITSARRKFASEDALAIWKADKTLCPIGPTNGRTFSDSQKEAISIRNRGEGCAASKLTDIQVREIRASNETANVLAGKYSVLPGTIRAIKNYKTWKHIT